MSMGGQRCSSKCLRDTTDLVVSIALTLLKRIPGWIVGGSGLCGGMLAEQGL